MSEERERETIDEAATRWLMALRDAPHDPQLRQALAAWLTANPAHRSAYEETRRVWILTGLLAPAANDDATDDATSSGGDSKGRCSP
jgi:ferric-dicitrate binding protein FerR (iron transport regulator)